MKKRSDIITVMIFMILCMPASVLGAGVAGESYFHPYLIGQEEYNDNINLTPTNKSADYITTVGPGLSFNKADAMSGMDLDYKLGFVYYNKDTDKNYLRQNGSLNAKYLTKGHVNFYLKDLFIQSDEPRELEPLTTQAENKYVLSIAPERAVYWRNIVEPTIEYKFGPENRVRLIYRNNIYRTTRTDGQDSQENYLNSLFDYWYDKRNGVHLEYGYTLGNFEQSPNMNAQKANVRYSHRFNQKSGMFGEYTYSKRSFGPSSSGYDIHEPSVGMTHAFSPTLNTSAQIGYFGKNPTSGTGTDGLSYKASITQLDDLRTTYILTLQGGFTEDYFTSENLGFKLYHRLTGSWKHFLAKRTSIGFSGSVERVEFDQGRKDWMQGVTGTLAHQPLKWLTVALECSHRVRSSNIDSYDYTENRAMIKITATY